MTNWQTTALGDILSRSDEVGEIRPDESYKEITVKLWGKGVVLRRIANGAELNGSRRFLARQGQLILSRIDARNGAIGIVPESLEGSVVSNDFPLFQIDNNRVLPQYLEWLSKTKSFVELCQRASEGTTNRVRLQEDRFLNLQIHLPSLPEQRRIVARIEGLAGKINEARTLRRESEENLPSLMLNQAGRLFANLAKHFPDRKFGSFFPHVSSGPRNWAKHYEEHGYRFYRAQDVGPEGQVLRDSRVFIDRPPGEQGRSAMLEPGDLLLVITGATVGRVAVFRDGLEPGFVNQHVAICRLPSDEVAPEFAIWGLRAPDGQAQLLGQRYGQGKAGLNLTNIRHLHLPFPPLAEQRRVVTELDRLQTQVNALTSFQRENAAEIDALLPSILDKAFKGEM